MESSVNILESARQLYNLAIGNYRDHLLKVGHLIHDYVVAVLTETSQYSHSHPKRVGRNRNTALKTMAETLGCDDAKVRTMLCTSMAVALFNPKNAPLKDVRYTNLAQFRLLIHRRREGKSGMDVTPIEQEQWFIKPDLHEQGSKLFQMAVDGRITLSALKEKLRALARIAYADSLRERDDEDDEVPVESTMEDTRAHDWYRRCGPEALVNASVGDAADAIWELLQVTSSPRSVLQKLADRLRLNVAG